MDKVVQKIHSDEKVEQSQRTSMLHNAQYYCNQQYSALLCAACTLFWSHHVLVYYMMLCNKPELSSCLNHMTLGNRHCPICLKSFWYMHYHIPVGFGLLFFELAHTCSFTPKWLFSVLWLCCQERRKQYWTLILSSWRSHRLASQRKH